MPPVFPDSPPHAPLSAQACRVCGQALLPEPLLRFANMPRGAQLLPGADELAEDRGIPLDIHQCAGCGLVQAVTPPVPYYQEVIRAVAFSPEMREFRVGQFARFVERFQLHGKKLLEVGCGKGEFLALFHQAGVEAHGIEAGTAAVAQAQGQPWTVRADYLASPTQQLGGGPFAAFAVLNFLEHWPEPNRGLQGLRANLSDDAVGLVEVPNFDMILRHSLFSEFISDHLLYFTGETLETTLRLNGFEVLEMNSIWHDYILSATVRKRAGHQTAPFVAAQSRLQQQIAAFIGEHAGDVAIWGAGHQALATLALLDLGGQVRYLIDSAPFKQGRYTPVTHLPILPPDTLESQPVRAILVMAASYSDEVAGIIRARHGDRFALAIVRDTHIERLPPARPA